MLPWWKKPRLDDDEQAVSLFAEVLAAIAMVGAIGLVFAGRRVLEVIATALWR